MGDSARAQTSYSVKYLGITEGKIGVLSRRLPFQVLDRRVANPRSSASLSARNVYKRPMATARPSPRKAVNPQVQDLAPEIGLGTQDSHNTDGLLDCGIPGGGSSLQPNTEQDQEELSDIKQGAIGTSSIGAMFAAGQYMSMVQKGKEAQQQPSSSLDNTHQPEKVGVHGQPNPTIIQRHSAAAEAKPGQHPSILSKSKAKSKAQEPEREPEHKQEQEQEQVQLIVKPKTNSYSKPKLEPKLEPEPEPEPEPERNTKRKRKTTTIVTVNAQAQAKTKTKTKATTNAKGQLKPEAEFQPNVNAGGSEKFIKQLTSKQGHAMQDGTTSQRRLSNQQQRDPILGNTVTLTQEHKNMVNLDIENENEKEDEDNNEHGSIAGKGDEDSRHGRRQQLQPEPTKYNQLVVHTYAFPNGLMAGKKQRVWSEAERLYGNKYSEQSLASLLHFKLSGVRFGGRSGFKGRKMTSAELMSLRRHLRSAGSPGQYFNSDIHKVYETGASSKDHVQDHEHTYIVKGQKTGTTQFVGPSGRYVRSAEGRHKEAGAGRHSPCVLQNEIVQQRSRKLKSGAQTDRPLPSAVQPEDRLQLLPTSVEGHAIGSAASLSGVSGTQQLEKVEQNNILISKLLNQKEKARKTQAAALDASKDNKQPSDYCLLTDE